MNLPPAWEAIVDECGVDSSPRECVERCYALHTKPQRELTDAEIEAICEKYFPFNSWRQKEIEMSLRDDFEKLFPVPEGVVFKDGNFAYEQEGLFGLVPAIQYRWQGFQAGHAAGLEAAAKYVEDEGYAGLPIGIRAMKP